MGNFTVKGNGNFDDMTAKLKQQLDENDRQFNAQLEAMFKPAGKPAPEPQPQPPSPAGKPRKPGGWGNSTSRKGGSGGFSRLRG